MCHRPEADDGTGKAKETADGFPILVYRTDGKPIGSGKHPHYVPPPSAPKAPVADINRRHDVYLQLLEALTLSEEHQRDLLARGLSKDTIMRCQFRSMPQPQKRPQLVRSLMERVGDVTDIPGFIYKEGKTPYWTLSGKTGILIPSRDTEERIQGFKIRADKDPNEETDKTKKKNRYRWLSSAWEGHDGPSPGNPAHLPMKPPDMMFIGQARVTEGELKAEVATHLSGIWTIGLSGVGQYQTALRLLNAIGASSVLLAYDAETDKNPNIWLVTQRSIQAFQEAGLSVSVECWSTEHGKGIDDFLASGRQPEVVTGEEMLARLAANKPAAPKRATWFESMEPRIKEDIGVLLEPSSLRMIRAIERERPADWARIKQLAKKHSILSDLKNALKDLEEVERAKAIASGDAPQDHPAAPTNRAGEPGADPQIEVGDTVIVWRLGAYHRAIQRFNKETGKKDIVGYAPITNWSFNMTRAIRFSDDRRVQYEGVLRLDSREVPMTFDHTELSDPKLFQQALYNHAAVGAVTDPNLARLSLHAVSGFAKHVRTLDGVTSIGYLTGPTSAYVMPSIIIRAGVIEPNLNHPVMMDGEVTKLYDLPNSRLEDAEEGVNLLMGPCLRLHNHSVTLMVLGAMLCSVLISKMQWQKAPLYLEGPFGSGKSMICRAFMNLFADVPMKGGGALLSATSTVGSLQYDLYRLRDVPSVIDDVKMETTDARAIFTLLQTIHDGAGRGRLSNQIKRQRNDFVARGQVLITGEEIPPHVASAISRLLIVSVPDGLRVEEIDTISSYRKMLRSITPHFIAWTQLQDQSSINQCLAELELRNSRTEVFAKQIMSTIFSFFRFLHDTFKNWRSRSASERLHKLWEEARDHMHEIIDHTGQRTMAESKEDSFIQSLGEAFDMGKVDFGMHVGSSTSPVIGRPWVEFDNGVPSYYLDISPGAAVDVVTKMSGQKYSKETLGEFLRNRHYIKPDIMTNRPTVRRGEGGRQVTFWRMPANIILSNEGMRRLMKGVLDYHDVGTLPGSETSHEAWQAIHRDFVAAGGDYNGTHGNGHSRNGGH